jgi:transcriptional regulator with XRE-family HTH domain
MTPEEFLAARKDLGLTQPQLAGVLGWTQSHISRVENGREPIQQTGALAMQALLMGHRPDGWPIA